MPTPFNNYEIMRDQMAGAFLRYDQEAMIEKFSLRYDANFLYIRFVGREYRIDRHTGTVSWEDISFGFIGDFIKDTQARKIVEVVTPDGSFIPKYLDSDEAIIEFYYTSKEQLICIKEKLGAIKNIIHDCGYAIKCIYEAPDSSNGLGTVNICFTKARSKE